MTRILSGVLLAILLVIPLAACGNGDDDDDPTETLAAEASPSAPITEPTASSATAESTPAATAGTAASPETGDFTDEEAALLDLLLSAGDLPGTWSQLRVEAPELSESPGICDAPRFPRANERIAEVEVEYQSADGSQFVLQDITQFPEEVAVEAMAYVRETATCSEWTDETGTVFEVSPAEAPALGDESHALHVAFQVADAGRLEGDFIFVRIDGYVTIVTTLTLGDYDPAFSSDIAQLAASKIDSLVGTGSNVTDEEATLMAALLTLDDFDETWDQPQPAHRSDPESWTGLCNAELFPGTDEAVARVATEFYEGFEADSATVSQLLVAYPTGQAEAAFDHEVEAASCGSFTSGGTDITLETDTSFPALGDETFATRFTFDNDDGDVSGYWIVIRVADSLTTLIYTDPAGIDDAAIEDLATAAANRMAEALR
jgi:hypothetical protein